MRAEGGLRCCNVAVQAISGGELVLSDLRLPGLDLAAVVCSARPSAADGLPAAGALLCVALDDMPPQELRVCVRPGAPHRMQLEPGHPWAEVTPNPEPWPFILTRSRLRPCLICLSDGNLATLNTSEA